MSSQTQPYLETTVDKIIRYLKDWDNAQFFKVWFYGDDSDMDIALEQMPCGIVFLIGTNVKQGPTGRDEIQETIRINLVLNRTDYMNDFGDETIGWRKKLELMIQGQDPVTQYYDATTILGVLRTNFTLGNVLTDQTIKITYGEVDRNNPQDTRTGEAWVTLTVTRFIDTPAKT